MAKTPDRGHDARQCDGAVTAVFGFLGKRWNGPILSTLAAGPMGFSDLRRAVDGISDSMLSDRLSELAALDLVVREVDAGPPTSVNYRLTEAGEALGPSLQQLREWAQLHLRPLP